MKNSIKYYILTLAATFTLCSCGDFLEEYSQDHDYVRSWNDLNELLIGDCYMPVNAGSQFNAYSNAGLYIHLFSDELEEQALAPSGHELVMGYKNHSYQFGYLTWQPRVGSNEMGTSYYTENMGWTQIYKYINVANNVLTTSSKVPQNTDSEKAGVNYVNGQAHFLRAFYYFWLTNTYGQPYNPSTAVSDLGVPLKTSQEVQDIKFSRNTVQECYDQIVSDLESAITELKAASSIKRKSIYRVDAISAELLLSRVYLYMQNWEKAAEYAQKVIDAHPDLDNLNTDKGAFALAENPETLFSMGGDDLPNWIDFAAQSLRVSGSMYNSFVDNDLRKTRWIYTLGSFHGITKQPAKSNESPVRPQTDPYYYYSNYTNRGIQRAISSMFWLRSGEAYMNLAEVEAYLGDEQAAREAVNKIRKNRFVTNAKDWEITSTGNQLISDIRNERKHEFICEGHRWFDLRRYRVCSVQPEKISIKHTFTLYVDDNSYIPTETRQYILTEDDPSWTVPIPQEVIEFNTGMPNNGNQPRSYTVVATPN